jgi:hypothetical protein
MQDLVEFDRVRVGIVGANGTAIGDTLPFSEMAIYLSDLSGEHYNTCLWHLQQVAQSAIGSTKAFIEQKDGVRSQIGEANLRGQSYMLLFRYQPSADI